VARRQLGTDSGARQHARVTGIHPGTAGHSDRNENHGEQLQYLGHLALLSMTTGEISLYK
jgi:hypothetical protein